jgi:hypothetical protein
MKFGNLTVTHALLMMSHTCLWREERSQNMALVAVVDERSGERGHVLYCLETDKREILEEETWTDNPALFATEHPEAYQLQDLLNVADETTPSERNEEIDKVLAACWGGSPVTYEEGPDGWGLYAK